MNLPRHAEFWLPGYVRNRVGHWTSRNEVAHTVKTEHGVHRVWLAIGDHFEPYYQRVDAACACERVDTWIRQWPSIAARYMDSNGRPPKYTFFYPEEEYDPGLMDKLASMA